MCIEEKIPPLVSEYEKAGTDGYEWYPRGLLEAQVYTVILIILQIVTYLKHFRGALYVAEMKLQIDLKIIHIICIQNEGQTGLNVKALMFKL